MLLPVLVAIMVAKWVADAFTHSLYHAVLEVKCVPILHSEPQTGQSLDLVPVHAVMASPVVTLQVRGALCLGISQCAARCGASKLLAQECRASQCARDGSLGLPGSPITAGASATVVPAVSMLCDIRLQVRKALALHVFLLSLTMCLLAVV